MDIPKEWNITPSLSEDLPYPVYRFIPGCTQSEGLFMTVIRKTDGVVAVRKKDKKKNKPEKRKGETPQWLLHQEDYQLLWKEELLTAIPQRWYDTFCSADSSLKIIHAGIPLATFAGQRSKVRGQNSSDLRPTHALALSTALDSTAFPTVDVDVTTALQYLRKETITLPEGMPKGFVLITYQNHPLGFVKNLGNRTNNLFPAEWKIKSGHLPDSLPVVLE